MSNNPTLESAEDIDSFLIDIVKLKIRINGDAKFVLSEMMESNNWRDSIICLVMTGRKKEITFVWQRKNVIQRMLDFLFPRHKKLQRVMERHGFTFEQYQRFYANVLPESKF